MTRISEIQRFRTILSAVNDNRNSVDLYSEQIATGYKAKLPGESRRASTIVTFQNSLKKISAYKDRINNVQSYLDFQEQILGEASDLLIRAEEIATQASNETISEEERANMAEEVFQLRDQIVSLANSKYQGRYIFAGAADDQPAFSKTTNYTNPSSGDASVKYAYSSNDGSSTTRSVQVTDDLSVRVNTAGDTIFENAIWALERLGRSLAGYKTEPATGEPDGSGDAYDFPSEFSTQTDDILSTIDLIKSARDQDVLKERTNIAGRIRRLQTASSLLETTENSEAVSLSNFQDADLTAAATKLTQAQTALQASLTVTAQLLQQNILNYL